MSSDTTSVRKQIITSLADKEYRDLLVQESINQGIAFQIKANRLSRGWTQGELGRRANKKQSEISRLEDPDYESYTLRTLAALASAFDFALSVRFVPFSELANGMSSQKTRGFVVPSFGSDAALQPRDRPELGIQTAFLAPRSSNVLSISNYKQKASAIGSPTSIPTTQEDYQWQTSPNMANTPVAAGR